MAAIEPALNVLKTIAGIGGLIFVHELGHFLVGRWCGVRAEAFSIGFGPVLWKWQPGPTEYRISALPLGGYVKFLGENPGEDGGHEPDSFPAATYPRKAAILLAGVTMNVIAAFVLFVATFSMGIAMEPPVVGSVEPGMPAWAHGLQPGDRIVTINGGRVVSFRDVVQDTHLAERVVLEVDRDGRRLTFDIPTSAGPDGLHAIGIRPSMSADNVLAVLPDGEAEKAGFRDGDRVVRVDGTAVATVAEAAERHAATQIGPAEVRWTVERGGETVDLQLPLHTKWMLGVVSDSRDVREVLRDGPAWAAGLRPADRPVAVGGVAVPTVFSAREAVLDPANPGPLVVERAGARVEIALPPGDAESGAREAFGLSFASPSGRERVVSPSPGDPPGPAATAGIEAGSEILEIDGAPILSWGDLTQAVARPDDGDPEASVRWRTPAGEERSATVTLRRAAAPPKDIGGIALTEIVQEKSLTGAIALGMDRTHRWVMRIFDTLRSLISGGVSPRKLSGPIAIATIGYQQAKTSWAEFFLFMGFISMNLAVLNVLPIPVLDGGQLAMITAEKVYGRPLPPNLIHYAQLTGFVLLLALMVYVIGNDIVNLVS